MFVRLFAAALFALFLSACNPMAQLEQAEGEITQFHATYNAGDSRALYGTTADDFREITTAEQMDGLVQMVTDRMGKVESTERAGFNINSDNGTTYTVVTMTTMFEKGKATETFTYVEGDQGLELVGWNVDSPNFLDESGAAVEGEAAEAELTE